MREKTNFPFRAILTTLKLRHFFVNTPQSKNAPKRVRFCFGGDTFERVTRVYAAVLIWKLSEND